MLFLYGGLPVQGAGLQNQAVVLQLALLPGDPGGEARRPLGLGQGEDGLLPADRGGEGEVIDPRPVVRGDVHAGAQALQGQVFPPDGQGQLLRLADKIAYINHDIEDALRGGIIYPMDIPLAISKILGFTHGERIERLVLDIVANSQEGMEIHQSPEVAQAMAELKNFMFEAVYFNPKAKGEESKAEDMICHMFEYYCKHHDNLPGEYQDILVREGVERAVTDYIAGMSDAYAVEKFEELFIPMRWMIK